MKLTLDPERCCGCYACHIACLDAHFSPWDPQAVSFRRTQVCTLTAEGFQKTICTSCRHCDPAPCINACPTGAIYRDPAFDVVLIRKEACVGCGRCAQACPQQAITAGADGTARKCDGCVALLRAGEEPACVRVCFLKAISME